MSQANNETGQATYTADLGGGWFATKHAGGTFSLRNPDKGRRINLTANEVERFVQIYQEAEQAVSA